MTPHSKALQSLKESLLAKKQPISRRTAEIKETNEKSHMWGNALKSKGRHDRRHNGAKGTSLAERRSWMSEAGKDL